MIVGFRSAKARRSIARQGEIEMGRNNELMRKVFSPFHPFSRSPLLFFVLALCSPAAEPAPKIENVIFVTTDGFRPEEFFGGAQADYMTRPAGGVYSVPDIKKRYDAETPETRREKLLPFIWGTLAKKGQVFGSP